MVNSDVVGPAVSTAAKHNFINENSDQLIEDAKIGSAIVVKNRSASTF